MLKVIIIDDEKIVCRTVTMELEEAGCAVDYALSGREGVKKIVEGEYDHDMHFTDYNQMEEYIKIKFDNKIQKDLANRKKIKQIKNKNKKK